jgi:hypothetical protein
VTPAEIIYQRRIAVLDQPKERAISRTRYHELKNGPAATGSRPWCPRAPAPQMPEATPTHVVEAL